MTVGKKIEILHLSRFTGSYPLSPVAVIVHEQVSGALVHHGPAVPREDAQFHRIRIVEMVGTGAAVQRAGRAHQIAGRLQSGMPDDRLSLQLETGLEIVGGKLPAFIDKRQCVCRDRDPVAAALDGEVRHRQLAVDDSQCRMVFELGLRRPFHPDQPISEDRKAGIPGHHLSGRIGYGIVLGKSRTEHRQQQSGYKDLFHNSTIFVKIRIIGHIKRSICARQGDNRRSGHVWGYFCAPVVIALRTRRSCCRR